MQRDTEPSSTTSGARAATRTVATAGAVAAPDAGVTRARSAADAAAPPRDALRSLQVLRALAAASVVYFHIGASPRFGSFGVDVFFVVSGLVMAMIVARGESARTFLVNRVTRIVPLYWVVTTAILLAAIALPALLPGTRVDLGDYLRSLLFIPYRKGDEGLYPMLSVGWTLNYEMAFYAMVWLAVVFFRRHAVLAAGAMVVTVHLLARTVLDGTVAGAFFGEAIVFEFLFGMAAYQVHARGLLRGVPRTALAIAAIGAYGFMAVAETRGTGIDRALLYGVPSVVLVCAALSLEPVLDALPRALSGALVAIGDASYATYLVHWLVIQAMVKSLHAKAGILDPHSPLGIAILMIAALAAGQLAFEALDRPLSRRVRSWFGPTRAP